MPQGYQCARCLLPDGQEMHAHILLWVLRPPLKSEAYQYQLPGGCSLEVAELSAVAAGGSPDALCKEGDDMLGIWCLGGESIMCWSWGEPTRGLSSELVWDDVLMPCGPERLRELKGACRRLHGERRTELKQSQRPL